MRVFVCCDVIIVCARKMTMTKKKKKNAITANNVKLKFQNIGYILEYNNMFELHDSNIMHSEYIPFPKKKTELKKTVFVRFQNQIG